MQPYSPHPVGYVYDHPTLYVCMCAVLRGSTPSELSGCLAFAVPNSAPVCTRTHEMIVGRYPTVYKLFYLYHHLESHQDLGRVRTAPYYWTMAANITEPRKGLPF